MNFVELSKAFRKKTLKGEPLIVWEKIEGVECPIKCAVAFTDDNLFFVTDFVKSNGSTLGGPAHHYRFEADRELTEAEKALTAIFRGKRGCHYGEGKLADIAEMARVNAIAEASKLGLEGIRGSIDYYLRKVVCGGLYWGKTEKCASFVGKCYGMAEAWEAMLGESDYIFEK